MMTYTVISLLFCSGSAVLIRTGRQEVGNGDGVGKHANEPDRLAD